MIVVIWIDWYSYHVARFRALAEHPTLGPRMLGIELVGGTGVHENLLFRDDQRAGLSITTLEPKFSWRTAGQRRLAKRLWAKLNELKPDAVFVPGYYTLPGLAAAVWAKINRKRSILMSETTAIDHERTGWKEGVKKLLLRFLFDLAVVGGERHTSYLKSLGFKEHKIARGYNVVDNQFYSSGADQVRSHSRRDDHVLPVNYFLYVGRLASEKNIFRLISEFSDYRKCGGAWDLVLVGDGPLAKNLHLQVAALGLTGQVHFAGLKNAHQMLPYYAYASCFILPSVLEPWGLVVNEAMASALPVIVSDRCGSSAELVEHEVNGFVFNPKREGEITRAMTRMAAMTDAEREAMGKNARAKLENYSPETWASEVARIMDAA